MSPSGEDTVFNNEAKLLRRHGIEVVTYEKNNDAIGLAHNKIKTAIDTVWSRETYGQLKGIIRSERPDIAHFHNIWYVISPSAYYACRESGVPIVQTVHNFRMFCANGLLMRNGRTCEECVGRMPWKALFHGCYNGSRVRSFPIAMTEMVHKMIRTWTEKVDAFIALTEFGRKKLVECGLPEDKIFVKPNFLLNPPPYSGTYDNRIVFVGRLSAEKGVSVLIDALKRLGSSHLRNLNSFSCTIVGDGALRKRVEERVCSEGIRDVRIAGRKNFAHSMEILGKAEFMVMPTICYEMFPLTTIEAFACGKAVVASRIGALKEILEDGRTGLLFEPGNADDLAAKMKWMVENKDACIEMGRRARAEFEAKYTAEKNFGMLMGIYERALKNRR